ncbi:MAG: hypothetical protein KDA24_23610 [Deltaproteobacteria bacterium]|nr:hypothetical protein [Deltaproteobacteria bacterium]
MHRFPPTLSALAVLAVLLANTAAPRSAEATSALAFTVPEMAQLSAAVVVGSVGTSRQEVHPRYERPVTATTVRVEKVLAGSAPATLEVRQWRGTLDGRSSAVPGDPSLERGERGLFFLRQVDGQWFLTALSQAYFTMGSESDPHLARDVDVALWLRAPDGTLSRLESALPAPTTLSAMEAVLAGVVVHGPEGTQ